MHDENPSPSETLRCTAELMRADADRCGDGTADFFPALADWLDTAGADLWAHGPLCECGSGCHNCDDDVWQPHVRRALVVADAYLGETA